ncbi:eceriferum 1-like protein isoform X1 [Tanacetum coccineum]
MWKTETWVKVFSLGGELNKSGELFIKRNPQLKVNVVDESSLGVAVVLYNISKGTTQVVIRGDFNKVAYYHALALCQRGIQVAISKDNDYQKLKSKLQSTDAHDRWTKQRRTNEGIKRNFNHSTLSIPSEGSVSRLILLHHTIGAHSQSSRKCQFLRELVATKGDECIENCRDT